MERYQPNKNKEGYSDLTAYKEIKKADKNKPKKPKTTEAEEQKTYFSSDFKSTKALNNISISFFV